MSTRPDEGGREGDDDKVELRRVIGLPTAVSMVMGSIIGAGIFVNPTAIGRQLESVGASLVMWLACGLFNILCT